MNLSNELNIPVDEPTIAMMLIHYWGDRNILNKVLDYSDDELVILLKQSNLKNWVSMVEDITTPLGITTKEVINVTEQSNNKEDKTTDKVNKESALNVDEFIDIDSVNYNQNTVGDKDRTLKQEKYKINFNKLKSDMVDKINNLWYNISKNIANDITLKIY